MSATERIAELKRQLEQEENKARSEKVSDLVGKYYQREYSHDGDSPFYGRIIGLNENEELVSFEFQIDDSDSVTPQVNFWEKTALGWDEDDGVTEDGFEEIPEGVFDLQWQIARARVDQMRENIAAIG